MNCTLMWQFIDELLEMMDKDNTKYGSVFDEEIAAINNIKEIKAMFESDLEMRGTFVWKADNSNSVRRMSNVSEDLVASMQSNSDKFAKLSAIKEFDESRFL